MAPAAGRPRARASCPDIAGHLLASLLASADPARLRPPAPSSMKAMAREPTSGCRTPSSKRSSPPCPPAPVSCPDWEEASCFCPDGQVQADRLILPQELNDQTGEYVIAAGLAVGISGEHPQPKQTSPHASRTHVSRSWMLREPAPAHVLAAPSSRSTVSPAPTSTGPTPRPQRVGAQGPSAVRGTEQAFGLVRTRTRASWCFGHVGATLGATRMYDTPILRTYMNIGQGQVRGHGLI